MLSWQHHCNPKLVLNWIYNATGRAKMASKISTLCLIILLTTDTTLSAKILVLHPSPSKSHVIVARPLINELARRGHEVTMFSQFPSDKPVKNLRDIKVEVDETITDFTKDLVKKTNKLVQFFKNVPKFVQLCTKGGEAILQHPEFHRLTKEESFDLVIVGVFITHFMFGAADHFKCPQIGIWSAGTFTNIDMVGMTNPSLSNLLLILQIIQDYWKSLWSEHCSSYAIKLPRQDDILRTNTELPVL